MIGIGNYVMGDTQARASEWSDLGPNTRPTGMPSANVRTDTWEPMDVERAFGTMTGGAGGIPGWAIGLGIGALVLVGIVIVVKKMKNKRRSR